MTHQQKIEKIRSEVIRAVPSILELKFGCKVKDLFNNENLLICDHSEGMDTFLLDNGHTSPRNAFDDKKGGYYEIIGRDINLEDVLITMNRLHLSEQTYIKADGQFFENTAYGMPTKIYWTFNKPLKFQIPETINFLHDLFFNKKDE